MTDALPNVKPAEVRPGGLAALKNVLGMSRQVETILARAPSLPNIGVTYGRSGEGKSYGAISLLNRYNGVRVEIGESWNAKKLVTEILRECGIPEPRGTVATLVEQAIGLLAANPRAPLLIDEADKLVDKGRIEIVREIAEHSQVPVILIGEEMLPQKLQRYERVHNRVLDWYGAVPCDLEDCKKLARIFLRDMEIDDPLLDDIRAKGDGRARRIVVSLNGAYEWARNCGVKKLDLNAYRGVIYTGEAPAPRRFRNGRAA